MFSLIFFADKNLKTKKKCESKFEKLWHYTKQTELLVYWIIWYMREKYIISFCIISCKMHISFDNRDAIFLIDGRQATN